jgi:tetratricopeptide (TPR) repeat protein
MRAVCHRYLSHTEEAENTLNDLISRFPEFGRGYQELGHLLLSISKHSEALTSYRQAVRLNPSLFESWQKIEQLADNKDETQTAKDNLLYIQRLPAALRSTLNLIHENKLADAEKLCRQFLAAQPKHIEAIRLLALIAEKANVLDDAEFLLTKIVQNQPDYHWARYDLVNVLYRRQKFFPALEHATHLHDKMPNDASILLLYANQLFATGQYSTALDYYQKVLTREPNNIAVFMQLGHLYKTLGDQAEAINAYQNVIQLNGQFGDAYWSLANLKTFRFTAQQIQEMRLFLDDGNIPAKERIFFHFALAKGYEDQAEFAFSFEHYSLGNQLKRQLSGYSSEQTSNEMQKQKQYFTNQVEVAVENPTSEVTPIFIVGLPRAGSTLVEQILSSHSQIEGTMELPHILSYVHELNGRLNKGESSRYPNILSDLTNEQLKEYGQRYLSETAPYRQGKPFFIDKMPNNFRHVGFIKKILPHARIIDVRRPAISCCFSNFKQLFAEGQEFSYSFADITQYYIDYVDLMTHWHSVFPEQLMHLDYQRLIDDTEGAIRELLGYLKLEVEPTCFEFYNTQRAVRTASAEQVRQPINRKGLEQWANFEPYLHELTQQLAAKGLV